MASFLSALKSAILTDATTQTPQQASPQNTAVQQATTQQIQPQPQAFAESNEKLAQAIAKVREAAFRRQSAMTQIMAGMEALSDVIPDPNTRIKAAFKTSSGGRTPQQILDAVAVHIADVDGTLAGFEQALSATKKETEDQSAAKIASLESVITSTTSQIQAYQQQITAAQQRIQDAQTQLIDTQRDAQVRVAEIEQSAFTFRRAIDTVRNEIIAVRDGIKTALS